MSTSRVVIAAIIITIGFGQRATLVLAQADPTPSSDEDYYHPSRKVHDIPDTVADAKARGMHEIRVLSPLISYVTMPDLDEALSVAAMALVRVSKRDSFYSDSDKTDIRSSVTFDVIEYLSGPEIISKIDPKAVRSHTPGGSPTVQIAIEGGTLIENGVKVVQRSRYPKLEPGQKYIAFLSAREDDGVIRDILPFGPNSLIGVNADGIVEHSPWITSDGLRNFLTNDESVPMFAARLKKMWGGAQ
jgi:hypothetical protein